MTRRASTPTIAGICLASVLAGAMRAESPRAGREPANAASAETYRAVLDRYCVTCHNQRLRTAGLTLDALTLDRPEEHADVWEKVASKLRAGLMPPPGVPRPGADVSAALAGWLEARLDAASAAHPNPGEAIIHRLNRAEYANAIRDLLALEADIASLLPPDDASYGFDNIADTLSLSPSLAARYLSAAARISRMAVGRVAVSPANETYYVRTDLSQEDRVSEDLPFGTRGGVAVAYTFPADGEYDIRVRLQRNHTDSVRGISSPHTLELRVDGARVQTFTVGRQDGLRSSRASSVKRDGEPPVVGAQTIVGGQYDNNYPLIADAGLHFRIPIKAGRRTLGVAFIKERSTLVEGLMDPARRNPVAVNDITVAQPGVAALEIKGPYNPGLAEETPSRRRIFVCRATSRTAGVPCATTILTTLARRAYRRPVSPTDLAPLLTLYRAAPAEHGFEGGIEMALRGLLVSPEFLFRLEHDEPGPAGGIHRITDLELASRLSFFLWSSIPDDELLDTAIQGRLNDPRVLEGQVRRMLADAKSRALVENFAGQWLRLRNVSTWVPDRAVAPTFDDNLRQAFLRETELFVEHIIREDRSVLDFVNADYTFVNERLARHYGIANVYGTEFRRVTLDTSLNRRGLMGQGSLLMVTAYPNRTSPVQRGKFILENLLGTPPPPPPPNVPELKEAESDGTVLPMRQRMERHRANPACATCHAQMDPLGFAFENFDAVGGWRTTDESGAPIDASGQMPDGTKFQGVAELREALMTRREAFVRTLSEKLLTYALGRGVAYSDASTIRAIVRAAAQHDYRMSSLITSIVTSTPFQFRRSASSQKDEPQQ